MQFTFQKALTDIIEELPKKSQVRIHDLCKGGPSRDFADIAQRSRGSGKNLGLKMGDLICT